MPVDKKSRMLAGYLNASGRRRVVMAVVLVVCMVIRCTRGVCCRARLDLLGCHQSSGNGELFERLQPAFVITCRPTVVFCHGGLGRQALTKVAPWDTRLLSLRATAMPKARASQGAAKTSVAILAWQGDVFVHVGNAENQVSLTCFIPCAPDAGACALATPIIASRVTRVRGRLRSGARCPPVALAGPCSAHPNCCPRRGFPPLRAAPGQTRVTRREAPGRPGRDRHTICTMTAATPALARDNRNTGTHHHIVYLGGILQHDNVGTPARPPKPSSVIGCSPVRQQPLFIRRIDPGTRHDPGPIEWANVLFVGAHDSVDHIRGENAFLDQ